jgi:DNA helicase HerA-like ATPase
MLLKEPGEPLERRDIGELLRELDRWLKEEKKMRDYQNAGHERKIRGEKLEEVIKGIFGGHPTLNRVAKEIEVQLENSIKPTDKEVFQDLLEFFEKKVGVSTKREPVKEIRKEEAIPQPIEEAILIGRVAPTIATPSTPTEFTFWLKDDDSIHLEVGNIVTARDSVSGVYAVGLVSEIKSISDIESVLDSFYAHSFGRPEEKMPTKLPCIMSAKAEVVRRSDGKAEPVRGMWEVTFATPKQIREAYGADISSEHEVLAGFTYDDKGNPVPITLDERYVLGYEAAHINIAGASGLATKTSYALFLLYSFLAYNERHKNESKETVAAIAFNVKEADLMFIDNLPQNWDELSQWKGKGEREIRESVNLWFKAKEDDFEIDPIKWRNEGKLKFYAPTHYSGRGVLSQRQKDVKEFNFSLGTLVKTGVGSLYALFEAEDLDEKAVALIASIGEEVRNEPSLTFADLFNRIKSQIGSSRNGRNVGEWVAFGGALHHRSTMQKVLNRMQHAVEEQLKGVILANEVRDYPIPIEKLKPGELWVIDITQLSDKGQRLVFQTVVRTVFQKLMERKTSELTGQLDENLKDFPSRVMIFVDELNKFVPAGREYSALKRDIVEMAARGRSVGMALCGAQQLASKVDEEVLANTSTFAVGRSHAVEIRKPPYGWLAEGLKERATTLDKGWMLLWHALHKRPVIIHFPLPLHRIWEKINQSRISG